MLLLPLVGGHFKQLKDIFLSMTLGADALLPPHQSAATIVASNSRCHALVSSLVAKDRFTRNPPIRHHETDQIEIGRISHFRMESCEP